MYRRFFKNTIDDLFQNCRTSHCCDNTLCLVQDIVPERQSRLLFHFTSKFSFEEWQITVKMTVERKKDRQQNRLSVIYGILLTSLSLLAICSILQFFGKQQAYEHVERKHHAVVGTSNNLDQQGKHLLEVAWLMSFPNSGTTYTNHLIQSYTNTTTGTNYGKEQSEKNESISIFPDSIDGPFFRYPSWSLPPRYILTKTHCGGNCDDCQKHDNKKYINTTEGFDKACRSGKRIFNNTEVPTTYSRDIPKRAIHLIRDPFDNIVARLHLKQRNWRLKHKGTKYTERLSVYNDTKEGFRAYCEFRDLQSFKREFHQRVLSHELLLYAKEVPCYAEFITYTRWHNLAIQLLEKKSFPVLTLFYEDYALDWDKTVKQILKFIQLTPAQGAKAEKFVLGKHYDEFYGEKEKLAAKKLVQELASAELWDLLQRYFS